MFFIPLGAHKQYSETINAWLTFMGGHIYICVYLTDMYTDIANQIKMCEVMI